jgi:hypothetical protein
MFIERLIDSDPRPQQQEHEDRAADGRTPDYPWRRHMLLRRQIYSA